jgi:DnaJ-class molecular chaperone
MNGYTETAPPCRMCRGTGYRDGRPGSGSCQFCDGSGYRDTPPVDTRAKLARALDRQREREGDEPQPPG